jgi:hypothetical protein
MHPARGPAVVAALIGLAGATACSSSSGGAPVPADAGGPDACVDTLQSVFGKSQCPADSTGASVGYDLAIASTCSTQNLSSGDIQFGQCLDYLVWEQDNDPARVSFSKCFYDVATHSLVGIVFSDGKHDQCGTLSTVQAGRVESYCAISGLTAGGGGRYVSCAVGSDASSDANGGTIGDAATGMPGDASVDGGH